jgi:CheY-like chemotaxis protein
VARKPRVLVFQSSAKANPLASAAHDVDFVYIDSVPRAVCLLRRENFDGIFADIHDLTLIQQAGTLIQADRILEMLADGVALVDRDLRIIWSNAQFKAWCGGAVEDKRFYEALGTPEILGPDYSPFHTALKHGTILTCLQSQQGRYLQLTVTPIRSARTNDKEEEVSHFITLCRDITTERQKQQKLDALQRAGRELAALNPKELASMSVEERVELLKSNILRYTRDLLHYDLVDIRLLDRSSGRLVPLVFAGMSEEACSRTLFANPEDNGISGLVAATGKSYLCPDTTTDPFYIQGAVGAKSSITVPLMDQDTVVGTLNVESPEPNAFTDQDQQFLEIFSRQIADALHTLELLVAEKRRIANQSIESIRREVALPVDEILLTSTGLLDKYIGHDEEMADELRNILANARLIKQSIEKVGEELAEQTPEAGGQPAHPLLKGLRVLMADPDERVRRSAHGLLERFGCIVETARDGREAQVMARASDYDAIVADIRLPDMTGFEIFRRLRQTQPTSAIILMSAFGYDPSHSLIKARQDGGLHGVLYKPFRMDQLIEVLEKLPRTPPPPTKPLEAVAHAN